MQYTWQLALVLVPVYFIKHSVSCYIYYVKPVSRSAYNYNTTKVSIACVSTGHVFITQQPLLGYDRYTNRLHLYTCDKQIVIMEN